MIATSKEKPIQQKRLYFKGVRLSDYALWARKNFYSKDAAPFEAYLYEILSA